MELDKLKHLIEHWREHNEEHAQSYLNWAGKAHDAGMAELAAALKELAGEAQRLEPLFKLASAECDKL